MRRVSILLLATAVIAGCAQTPPKAPAAPQIKAPWLADAKNQASVSAVNTVANTQNTSAPASVINEPSKIYFDAMSATVNDLGKTKIAALIEQAKAAKIISIRGFCDRTKVGNAKQAALARANAVKVEFVKNGVAANKFRMHYTTDQSDDAAVIELN